MSTLIQYEANAAPNYILSRFEKIKNGTELNPFDNPYSNAYMAAKDPVQAMMSGRISWADIMDYCTLYNLITREWEERRLKLIAEATKEKYEGQAINTFAFERKEGSYKQVQRLGITKKGPCCRATDKTTNDHSCWSFEYEDPNVKAELTKLEAELVDMKGQLEQLEKNKIDKTNPDLYMRTIEMFEKRMVGWMKEAEKLEANLVKKPHTCPWIHPGEEGWQDSWYTEYAWSTPEERKRKWAKFWADGKKEEVPKDHGSQSRKGHQHQHNQSKNHTTTPQYPPKKNMHVSLLNRVKDEDGWETVDTKKNNRK